MNKSSQLRICDWWLLILTGIILVSGILLEIISGGSILWVWFHIIVGIVFLGFICKHLQLHYRQCNLWKSKSSNMKWLAIVGLFTFITGIIVSGFWIETPAHYKIGAVHGKFGFLFLLLSGWHIIRRAKFYCKSF